MSFLGSRPHPASHSVSASCEAAEGGIRGAVKWVRNKACHLVTKAGYSNAGAQELPNSLRSKCVGLVCVQADGDDAARHAPRAPRLLGDADDFLVLKWKERDPVSDCAEAAGFERPQRVAVKGVVGRHEVGGEKPVAVQDPCPCVDGAHLLGEGAPGELRDLFDAVSRPD